jgi:hypothetical protein
MAHPSFTEEASDLVVPESLADAKTRSILDPGFRRYGRFE